MKKGFTLAEVLIAMGIVGIVSAMTIPNLVSEHKKQVYSSQLSTAVSNIENAFTTMMAIEGRDIFGDTDFWTTFETNKSDAMKILNKYLKITSHSGSRTDYFSIQKPYNHIYDSTRNVCPTHSKGQIFETKNGILVFMQPADNYIVVFDEEKAKAQDISLYAKHAQVAIDVNGVQKPNTVGRDLFYFTLGSDGKLYPYGSKIASFAYTNGESVDNLWNKSGSVHPCTANTDGLGCAARVIENGYKMDY